MFIDAITKSVFFNYGHPSLFLQAPLVDQTVKHLPVMWETWVQSLGREDPLEKGKATHSSTLARRIPWTGAWRATGHGAADTRLSN